MQKIQEEKAVKISHFQKQAGTIGKDVVMNNKRIPIEINGMKLLALVTYKDLERLEHLEQMEEQDIEEFQRVRREMGEAFKDVPEKEILENLDRIRKEFREGKQTNK